MGTRIIYQIMNDEHQLVATLFSNSSHTTQFAEEEFDRILATQHGQGGPNALLELLMAARYQTAEGNHAIGDRIFWIVPADEAADGDREAIVTVLHKGHGLRLTPLTEPLSGLWCKVRQRTD